MSEDIDGLGRLSPTLAAAFLGCSASAAWTLEARRGLRALPERGEDPEAALIVRKGHEHEAACLAALRERCGDFVESVDRYNSEPRCDPATRRQHLIDAMIEVLALMRSRER
jgi:hypothetical protein